MAGGAPIRISILANSRQARGELNSFAGTLKKTLGAGVALAGAYGGMELLKSIAREGSEAQQTLGGTAAVFKKHAAEVDASARKAADAVGLSANAYRTSATLMGSLLKGQGVAQDKLAGKTDELIALSADLAATFGGTTKDAVESLTSAFKGEFNPIEKYGVSLRQSVVNAEAVTIAQKKHGKALKDLSEDQQTAIKQQATYQLILGKTRDAQGQFARESSTAAGQQQRLAADIANTKARLGTSLLPVMTQAAKLARDELVPALDDFAGWFDDNIDEIAASGKTIAKTFLPPLEAAGSIAMTAAKALDSIPAPVKEMGVELLIAAKAYKVLNAATVSSGASITNLLKPVNSFRADMALANQQLRAGTITQAQHTAAVTKTSQALGSRLQPAVASAAGAAGMGLLLASTQQNDKALGGLMKAAGGAATGFAVGGPLGAAIGGIGGLLWGARDAFNATEGATRRAAAEAAKTQSWNTAKAAALELRDALYGTRDAYNEVTAASVKQGLFADGKKLGWVKDLEAAGVNIDTITRSILGQKDAMTLVGRAFKEQDASLANQKSRISELRTQIDAMGQLDLGSADEADVIRLGELQDELKALKIAYDVEKTAIDSRNQSYGKLAGTTDAQVARERKLRGELGLTKKQYDAMPKDVRTKVEAEGLPQTKSSVLDLLATTDKLSGRQVTAFVKQSGAQLARAEVEKLQKRFNLTPKQVATLVKVNGANKAKSDASKFGKDAGTAFSKSTAAGVRGSAGDVREQARNAVERARAAAGREADGADSVGARMTEGFARGIGTGAAVASAARSVIRNALAAARAEAEIKSPSRKAARDGKNISKGYAKGIKQGWPDVKRAITSGMSSLFGLQASPVTQYLADTRAQIRQAFNGKAEKRALKVLDQYAARVRKSYAAWAKNAAAIETNRARLEQLKQEADSFRSSVDSSVRGWFDPFRDALDEAAAFTNSDGLIGGVLRAARAESAQISQTTNLLNQAMKRGLGKDAYEKILALDPREANRIAVSLATATGAQIRELNGYYSTVNKQAAAAGTQAYNSFFKVGITAQQAVVDGLLRDKAAIERAATQLANAIQRATNAKLRGKKAPKNRKGTSVGTGTSARAVLASRTTTTVAAARPIQIDVNVSPTADKAAIGREIVAAIRAFEKVGGGR